MRGPVCSMLADSDRREIDRALTWLLCFTAPHLVSLLALDTMVLQRPPSARPLDFTYPRLREFSVVADHWLLEEALPKFLRGHRQLQQIRIVPMYRLSAPRAPLSAFDHPELTSLEFPLRWVNSFAEKSTRVLFANIDAVMSDPHMAKLARNLAVSPLGQSLVSISLSGPPPHHILACLDPVVRLCLSICEITLTRLDNPAERHNVHAAQLNVSALFALLLHASHTGPRARATERIARTTGFLWRGSICVRVLLYWIAARLIMTMGVRHN
ncbi:hypothetical protein DFH07DRAFT_251833 [Mycena maculata]|uniref:Uncharacterized protein n=1 Tax=Mycena maculata TaxID=230809 RepID=A0AAD7HRA4_9AGAR|nr:hypothetical protein DFH07DRAFT_251833 [Mycena maculata]